MARWLLSFNKIWVGTLALQIPAKTKILRANIKVSSEYIIMYIYLKSFGHYHESRIKLSNLTSNT